MDKLTEKQKDNLNEFVSFVNRLPMSKKQKIDFIKNISFEEMKNGINKCEIKDDEEKKPFFTQNGEVDDRDAELLYTTDKLSAIEDEKDV